MLLLLLLLLLLSTMGSLFYTNKNDKNEKMDVIKVALLKKKIAPEFEDHFIACNVISIQEQLCARRT